VGNVMRERYRNSISIFGGSKEFAEKLKCFENFQGKVSYDYDWRINGTESPG